MLDTTGQFECLPAEVRRHLLTFLDLEQLSATIHASPVYCQQFLDDRRLFLCESLQCTLGSVAVDAYAVLPLASARDEGEEYLPELLLSLMQNTSQTLFPLRDKLTEGEAEGMAAFYTSLVKPLVKCFASWLLENLDIHLEKPRSKTRDEQVLSDSETRRLMRATYRIQILSHVADRTDRGVGWSAEAKVGVLLDSLRPWETEELLTVYQFAQWIYDSVIDEVRWDLDADNPKFADQKRPPTPEGAFDLESTEDKNQYVEGLILHGLPLLHSVCCEVPKHEDLVSTIQKHMARSHIPLNTMEGVFGETSQVLRYQDEPTERHEMQEARAELPFQGNYDPAAPPLAWTLIWGGTYSNLYGYFIPDEIRRWGYIFWDAQTLRETGGEKLLKAQWEDQWEETDPRDEL